VFKYAIGLAKGKFRHNQLWDELIEAMHLHSKKESEGKGLQNFRYSPLLKQLAEEACVLSPSFYRNVLSKELPLPTHRSIKFVFVIHLFLA
jgi:hypothetical protein